MPELTGRRVLLREVQAGDADALRQIHRTPAVSAWWGLPDPEFPFDDAETTCLTILRDKAIVGFVQFSEETEPDYRHAGVDIFVDPEHHRQGIASDAIETVIHHLVEDRGHHRVTIDPAVANHAAIRCYEKAGFRPVGVMHAAWRDPGGAWRDCLLMELVVAGAG
ncbi:MAG: GNAT family N-acetyltransferase [Actinomycetota bacterium]|nr:GNAT family N-acetyltransferase [Actinomycetota bacterium]